MDVLVCSVQSCSNNGTQQELVFPSPEHETVDEDSALPLQDPDELPDMLLLYRGFKNPSWLKPYKP